MRRLILIIVVLALAGGMLIFFRSADAQRSGGNGGGGVADPNTQIIDSATVQRRDLTVTVSATGEVSPVRQSDLAFEISAIVTEVLVDEGETVEAGDVLARLEAIDLTEAYERALVNRDIEAIQFEALIAPPREVDRAVIEAQIAAAQAAAAASGGPDPQNIAIARLRVEQARNQLWQSQVQRDIRMELNPEFRGGENGARTEELLMQSDVASAETTIDVRESEFAATANEGPDVGSLSSARADRIAAEVALERLEEGGTAIEIEQAAIDLQRAELELERQELTLEDAVLRAPFSGVVADINLVEGELPPSDSAAMLLLDNSEFFVELEVDETDVVDLELDQAVELTFDALPGEVIEGRVTRINPTPTDNDQVVTYSIRVTLQEGRDLVRTGMSATGLVIVDELDDVLTVPTRFIRIDRATQQAFATIETADGDFEEVPVELGLRNDTQVQIVSGLDEGDSIVLVPRETFNPLGGN